MAQAAAEFQGDKRAAIIGIASAASPPTIVAGLATVLRLIGQGLTLWVLFVAGAFLSEMFSLPLPGNLVGMLLLLALLSTGVVRVGHVGDVAGFAVKHLNFFFIPFVVGLMAWTALFSSSGLAIGVSLVGSAVLGLTLQ